MRLLTGLGRTSSFLLPSGLSIIFSEVNQGMSPVQFTKDASLPKTWADLTLLAFFQSLRWEKESVADLKGAARDGDWEALKTALLPEVSASLEDITLKLPADEWPWAWSSLGDSLSPPAEQLLATLRKLPEAAQAELAKSLPSTAQSSSRKQKSSTANRWNETVRLWLDAQNCAPCSQADRLLWLDLFPLLAPHINAELFCSLWKKLFLEAALVSSEILNAKGKQRPSPLTQELAWRYSLLFWSVLGGDRVQALASAMLEQTLLEQTDESGTPGGDALEHFPAWLAPFIRAAREAQRAGVPLFNEPGQQRFRRLTHRALAVCSEEGKFLLSDSQPANPKSFLQQLLQAGDESVADFLLGAFPGLKSSKSGRGSRKPGALPSLLGEDPALSPRASFQSDEMRTACLRNYFTSAEAKIAIAHHTPRPLIELNAIGTSFLKGPWSSTLQRGKKSSAPIHPWSNTCWNTDEDSEYFEMQAELPGGGQLDRQILIPRKGHYAIFAEVLTKLPKGRIEHELRIPIAPGIEIQQDQKTREYRLIGPNKTARLFPLWFPQSKVDGTPGTLTVEGRELVLRTVAEGTGLYIPLVIDWAAERTKSSAVWKRLTVTENLAILPGDVAAGYRLKIEPNHQLLIYRSLQNTWEPRACLGFQTRYETAIGRVSPDGDLLPLMYVE